VRKKYFAAACPQRSRVCDSLFKLSPHMHARPKNSSYGNRGGPREAIEAKKGFVESHTDGASAAPTFLSLHRLHLSISETLLEIFKTSGRRRSLLAGEFLVWSSLCKDRI